MVVQWLPLLPHSKKVTGLIPADMLSLCLRGFSMGTPASNHSSGLHVRLINNSKFSKCVDGCLTFCVGTVINSRLVQAVPCLSPKVAWIGSSTLSAG